MADWNVIGIKSIKEQIQLIVPVLFSSRCPDSIEVQRGPEVTCCLAAATPPAFPWISPWPS